MSAWPGSSWTGSGNRIGFTRGWVNFLGHAGQDHYLEPLDEALIEDGSDLLFACGGSMLVGRDVFLELGGFDPAYFAFFEDVDLGWRLWLSGYKVRLAGGSRVLHRHHATASASPLHRLAVLYERNALSTLVKNVDDENLAPVLATALFMLAKRAVVYSRSSRESFEFGSRRRRQDRDGRAATGSHLCMRSRTCSPICRICSSGGARCRPVAQREDREIFALFNRPFVPFSRDEGYIEAGLNLRAAFGLDHLFTGQRVTRALVVDDGASERLRAVAAPSISAHADVDRLARDGAEDALEELLAESDLVIAQAATDHGE